MTEQDTMIHELCNLMGYTFEQAYNYVQAFPEEARQRLEDIKEVDYNA